MTEHWDAIIVGARCSGATLAVHLARAGARVLLLEAGARGTDQPMSTHFVQPPGMAALDRIGLGDRVRAVTPPSARLRLALDDAELISRIGGLAGYCVRRATLDPWLQAAAEEAGADLRDRHRVVGLLRDASGARVTGVVAETPKGRKELRAGLVVGADGPASTVARHVKAEAYLEARSDRGGYFFYFPAPPRWDAPWDGTLEHRGSDLRYVFRCDGDLLCLVTVAPIAEVESWGRDWREKALARLRGSPTVAKLAEGKEPVGRGMGVLAPSFFYRRPVGPGWALVGDAGHYKDYVTGMGMTDAFEDAERLAPAVLDGREVAFEAFWRSRDAATLPLHQDALRQGKVGFNSPFMRWIIAHLARRPDLAGRPALVFERKLSPADMVPTSVLLPWMGEALLRGRLDVLRGFLEAGKERDADARELAERLALAQAARARLAAPPRGAPLSAAALVAG